MVSEVKKITSDFLPCTASKIKDCVEEIHNKVKEEYVKCGHKFQELKEARRRLLKLLEEGHGQEEDEDEEEDKDKKKMEKTTRPEDEEDDPDGKDGEDDPDGEARP